MELKITGSNFIGSRPTSNGKDTFTTYSCRFNHSNTAIFHTITPEELKEVIQVANRASEACALLSVARRKDFLLEIIHLLEKHREILVKQFCKESSLSEERANSELSRTQKQIKTYVDFISRPNWNILSEEYDNGIFFQKRWFPLGTVVVFGASNFPFAYATIGGDVASALAAGNPVIYKANPFHAGLSEMLTQIILKAAQKHFIPEGIFSLVQGADHWIGEQLLKADTVQAVGFTGSVKGGTALLKYAKERLSPIPVFCEMGSLNPTFIWKDAFANKNDEMVSKLSHAVINDAGQFCTKPGLIFLEHGEAESFIAKMVEKFNQHPAIPMLHPAIYQAYQKFLKSFLPFQITEQTAETPENHAKPTIAHMTYSEFTQNDFVKEEVFGPFTLLISCTSKDEMKEAMQQIGGHLTVSFWTNETLREDWLYLFANKVGRIIQNGVSTGVAVIDSMHHGGNFPATSDSRFTAVGKDAIFRFMQPVTLQGL